MAIGHISIRVHTRSKGHSAAAGLAYRMGVDLVDPRTGVEHLYSRRTKYGDIVGCGMTGAGAFDDVAALAAAIESAEKRKNSSLMRDVQMALPCELNDEQCVALTSEFSALLARRYHTHTAWSVHRPDKRGDVRNKHGHIVVPTRELDATGEFGKKLRILDDHKTGRVEVAEIRQLWEGTANIHLERADHAARVYVGRREDGNPVPTLGGECTALEREAAAGRGEEVKNRSVAALVSTGEAVTWRGKALRRHQLGVKQQARQEERASAPADEQELATIAVTTAEPRAATAGSRVGLEAPPRPRPVNSGREARPAAVVKPAGIHFEQRAVSARRVLRVDVVQAHAVAEPKIITAARRSEGMPGHAVRVHALARPVRVRLGRVSRSPSIAAAVEQARPQPVAVPRGPAARSRPVATSVPVRPVRVVAPASPQEQDMTALEPPPPSLQQIADRLYEEVYAGEDAGAARRPADPRRGLAIGYGNWRAVRGAVRRDGDLCGHVAALAASRAADEGQRDYGIHQSWAGRIADWIREHVAAALKLLGLRRRQAVRLARRKTVESIAPVLGVDANAIYASAGPRGEGRLAALETTCYARAIGFRMEKFDTIHITAEGKRRGSGYPAVWEECVRTKAREEVRKVLPFEAPDRARPGAQMVAVAGKPSRDLLRQVADDEFVHGIVREVLAESAGGAEQREQAEDIYHRRRTELEHKQLERKRRGWFSSKPTREEAKQAVLERFVPVLAARVRKACDVRDLASLMARTVEEDRVRRVADALASALQQRKPHPGSGSRVAAVSDERFNGIASRTGDAVLQEVIATRFLEGHGADAADRSRAEEEYLGPRIRKKMESGLRQEPAEAAVREEYELELLRRMEAVCREVQQRSAAEVWRRERAPGKAAPARPALLPDEAHRHVGVDRRAAAPRPARGNQEKRKGWDPSSR